MVVASASAAAAVTPTSEPLAEFSTMVLVAVLASAGLVTSNSSTSVSVTVIDFGALAVPAASVAITGTV